MQTKILITLLLFGALFVNITPSQAQCHIDDWTALKALYESTYGDNWTNNEGWEVVMQSNPPADCDLEVLNGVNLDEDDRVGSLGMYDNQLSGSIPTEIGNLSKLTYLSLGDNQLTGSIPPELGNLSSLEYLNLEFNDLTGNIPAELGNLSNLTHLSLYYNSLTGSIPPGLANLSSLKFLNLGWNDLTGSIPPELGNLSSLDFLDLGVNNLTGDIPTELGNLSNLEFLGLVWNDLTGSIPAELGNLNNLTSLNLDNNQLSGCFDANLAVLCDQLINASISPGNNFNVSWENFCTLGTIACENSCHMDDWTALKALYESTDGDNWENNTGWEEVIGSAPILKCNLGNLNGVELDENGRVYSIILVENRLNGKIPSELSNLNYLTRLWLGNNQLKGSIPSELSYLTNLKQLNLSNNALTGCYSKDLTSLCTQLEQSDISNGNNFGANWTSFCTMGSYTCIPNCNRLDWKVLKKLYEQTNGNNWLNNQNWDQVTSTSPSIDCNLADLFGVTLDSLGRVKEIILNSNQLSGYIPPELGDLSNLTGLKLSDNQLQGRIPTKIGNLNNLTHLDLSANQLDGSIPPELGNLSNLAELWLHNNLLNGGFPPTLGGITSLNRLMIANNNLSGCYHPYLKSLCGQVGNHHASISQDNNFDDTWEGFCATENGICNICHYDDWLALKNLYLSTNGDNWNNNTGWDEVTLSTPTTDCNLEKLRGISLNERGRVESLRLIRNQLSGNIPSELGNLSNLQYLNLEDNQLTGNIPFELSDLSDLILLNLSENQLTGSIPAQLGVLNNLENLNLRINQLSDNIPIQISDLSNLTSLSLGVNQLSGSIPARLASLSNLTNLSLYSNQLSGSIPIQISDLSNLTSLNLHSNQLSGSIPTELAGLNNLTNLSLYSNQLSGSIPTQLGTLNNLEYLFLGDNQLSGSIPTQLGSLSKLLILHLGDNELSGNIPPQSGSIVLLYLNNNQLNGTIPKLNTDTLYQAVLSNNLFICDDINVNLEYNQQINSFNYTPQSFTPINYESIKTNVFDPDSSDRHLTLNVQLPWENINDFTYQWKRNDDTIVGANQATYIIDTVQPNNVGKYTLHISNNCLRDGNTFETISNPIHAILKGYDYNGEPVQYDQVMVRFDNEDIRKHYEATILEEHGGWRVDKCDCNRELHLWQFPDTEAATKALIDLDQKVVKVKPVTEVDGGFNNILNMNPVDSEGLAHHINIPNLNANANDPVSVYMLDSGLDKQDYDAAPHLINPAPIDSCYDFGASGYGYVSDFLVVNDTTITIFEDYTDIIGHGTFGFRSIADQLPQNSNIKVVPLQITKSYDKGTLFDLLCALYHAIDHNADIVNISAGFKGSPNPVFERAINEAREKGIFIVASAGNDSINIDQTPQYPAYYAGQYHYFETPGIPGTIPQLDSVKYDNVISVAAINTDLELYPYSNFGKESVVLSAPGENIAEYSLQGELDVLSGTSMATFFTTLGLALEYSVDNQRPYKIIWEDFKQNYLEDDSLAEDLTQTGKQLKFSSTIAMIEGCTDCKACNYKPYANIANNDSCIYCTDDRETTIKLACLNDATCPPCNDQFGCVDPAACNFNPEATTNNGSCSYDCEENADLVECPGEKRVNGCGPVNIPPALKLSDFSTGSDVVLSSQLSFDVDQQTVVHSNYATTTYTYTFTNGSDNQQTCAQSYHIANQFLQAPEVNDPPVVCQDDLWSYVKLGSDEYKIYADDNGIQGTELTTCNTPGLHCSTAGLKVNTATPGIHQFWVSQFFTFPDGSICESPATPFSMKVYPKPIAELNSESIALTVGQGIVLMDLINDNTCGYWTGENVIHLLTADGSNIPYFSANAAGLYKLYYTVKNERCQSSYLLVVEVSNGAKIEDKSIGESQVNYRISNEQEWHIYPNPANRNVQIEWIGGKTDRNTLKLLDLTGKILLEHAFEGGHFTFDVSELTKGIYLLEVENEQSNSIQKLLVE